jgi:hypothetical protein
VTGVTVRYDPGGAATVLRKTVGHHRVVTPGFALALQLLLAADGECYFIGNTRILPLPSCDLSPSTVEELTEAPDAVSAASLQRQSTGRTNRRRGAVRIPRPTVVVRGNEELERRLEIADQEKVTAVAERVTAEQERDAARRERDTALRERDDALRERDAARRERDDARRKLEAAQREVADRGGGVTADVAEPGR